MEGGDPHTMDAPAIRLDVLEVFVELLSQVEGDASSDAFYGRLCEAVCRLTSMERAVTPNARASAAFTPSRPSSVDRQADDQPADSPRRRPACRKYAASASRSRRV